MGVWKLCFVLLLLLPAYNNSEVTLVQTTGREPYITPICSNETLNTIAVITCKIFTERSRGEVCRLVYKYGEEFFNGCDSRFTLMKNNQTLFLHLSSLTPVDSGNYICECTQPEGTNILHLNITVEAEYWKIKEDKSVVLRILLISIIVVVGVTACIVVTGVLLGFILRKNNCRNCSRTDTSGLSVCEAPGSLDKDDPDDPDDPYTSLQQPANDLYQTISSMQHQHDAMTNSASNIVELDDQEIDEEETDPSYEIYENN